MTCRKGRPRSAGRAAGVVAGSGKQPGAPGAYLAWREVPDRTQDLFPQGGCACGADLAAAADLGVRYSHQVMDVPQARAQTTQYDRHEVACACGRRHVAGAPPDAAGAPGTVTYGLNVQAWCVFLLVMHHVPVERCADILESMSGTRPSDGWVHTVLARAARRPSAPALALVLSTRSSPPGMTRRNRFRPGSMEIFPRSSAPFAADSLSDPGDRFAGLGDEVLADSGITDRSVGVCTDHESVGSASDSDFLDLQVSGSPLVTALPRQRRLAGRRRGGQAIRPA